MKSFNILLVLFALIGTVPCLVIQAQEKEAAVVSNSDVRFGEYFELSDIKTGKEIFDSYSTMTASDSISMQLQAEVSSVCQVKGCWMNLVTESGDEVWVTFKDYSFFVPKDIAGKEVIVNGVAQIKLISEEDQKHYAEDAGKSQEEIDEIKGSKKRYSFVADGVALKE